MATRLTQSTPGSETRASAAAPELAFKGLLIRDGRRLVPIEIKLGAAVDRHKVASNTVPRAAQCATTLCPQDGQNLAPTGSDASQFVQFIPRSTSRNRPSRSR